MKQLTLILCLAFSLSGMAVAERVKEKYILVYDLGGTELGSDQEKDKVKPKPEPIKKPLPFPWDGLFRGT